MVAINLLPERARRGELITNYVIAGVLAVAAVFALFFALSLDRKATYEKIESDIKTVNAKLRSPELERIVRDVKLFTESQSKLKKEAEKLEAYRKEQVSIIELFDLLPDVLPAKASVRRLDSLKSGPGGIQFKLTVFVLDREIIPRFYENLSNHRGVRNVSIQKVSDNVTTFAKERGYDMTVLFEVGATSKKKKGR